MKLKEEYKEWCAKNKNIIFTAPDEVFEFMKSKLQNKKNRTIAIIKKDIKILQGIIDFSDCILEQEKLSEGGRIFILQNIVALKVRIKKLQELKNP